MKRETREWLKTGGAGSPLEVDANDILYSDAKQRATIRDLKARLKVVANAQKSHGYNCTCIECCEARAAADLTVRNWRLR